MARAQPERERAAKSLKFSSARARDADAERITHEHAKCAYIDSLKYAPRYFNQLARHSSDSSISVSEAIRVYTERLGAKDFCADVEVSWAKLLLEEGV